MKNNVLALTVAAVSLACSTPSPDAMTIGTSDDGTTCAKEERLGSMFRTPVCRTPSQIEKNRQDARTWDTERLRPASENVSKP
jgi:hypothetical protein